jgi:hypothetical protein
MNVGDSAKSGVRTNGIFEIRNSKFFWYRRRDSNPHCLVPKTSASSQLGYAGRNILRFFGGPGTI